MKKPLIGKSLLRNQQKINPRKVNRALASKYNNDDYECCIIYSDIYSHIQSSCFRYRHRVRIVAYGIIYKRITS